MENRTAHLPVSSHRAPCPSMPCDAVTMYPASFSSFDCSFKCSLSPEPYFQHLHYSSGRIILSYFFIATFSLPEGVCVHRTEREKENSFQWDMIMLHSPFLHFSNPSGSWVHMHMHPVCSLSPQVWNLNCGQPHGIRFQYTTLNHRGTGPAIVIFS